VAGVEWKNVSPNLLFLKTDTPFLVIVGQYICSCQCVINPALDQVSKFSAISLKEQIIYS
jgi:hypothetical protein